MAAAITLENKYTAVPDRRLFLNNFSKIMV
jgi:hypothetical protein